MMSAPVSLSHLFLLFYSIFLYSHFSNAKITSASAEYIKSEQVDALHLGVHSSGRSPPILMMMCQWALSHSVTHPNTLNAISAITPGADIPQCCAVGWRRIWSFTCACIADWADASLIFPPLCWWRSTISSLWPQHSWFLFSYLSFPPLYCFGHH